MANKKIEYDDQSISSLKGADRVRKRPAVIFGSDGLDGCEHSVFEILSNAVDEAKAGYGTRIELTARRDHSVTVEDFGRGVPLGYNENEGKYNWELIFCELFAGGKYNNNDEDAVYRFSLGLNGLGACATQYASAYMDVRSYKGDELYEVHFKKGEIDGALSVTPLSKKERRTGTVITWLPDLEVFTDIAVPKEYFLEMMKKQAVVNAGIVFVLHYEKEDGTMEDTEFCYPEGILGYVGELAGENPMTAPVYWTAETKGHDREDKADYMLKMEVSFCFSSSVSVIEYYHNSSFLEHGGSPDKAVRAAFLSGIDKYLRAQGKYNKNETKITFQDIEDCLVLVSSGASTQTSYANQTKKAITNTFIAEAMTEFLKHRLEVYFAEKPMDADRICGQVLINKRSRETAESTRVNLKKKLSGTMDLASRVEKFVSCRSKDAEKRELYIVEGDSALTSVKYARNPEFQAIIPVRGKTLNCLKAPYEKIFKNEIIVDLLKVVGCGVEIRGKVKGDITPFDYESLRWSKIILCTDADKDGYQIRTLLLTMFFRLLPTLIEKGRIYIAETPLYEINSRDQTFYAYNETEKAEIVKKIGNAKYTIQRSKGLGENSPEMMALTTMDPRTRHLIRITPTDAEETFRIFDIMLGDNVPARREFIELYGDRYLDDADLTE